MGHQGKSSSLLDRHPPRRTPCSDTSRVCSPTSPTRSLTRGAKDSIAVSGRSEFPLVNIATASTSKPPSTFTSAGSTFIPRPTEFPEAPYAVVGDITSTIYPTSRGRKLRHHDRHIQTSKLHRTREVDLLLPQRDSRRLFSLRRGLDSGTLRERFARHRSFRHHTCPGPIDAVACSTSPGHVCQWCVTTVGRERHHSGTSSCAR